MKEYLQKAKQHIGNRKNEYTIGAIVTAITALIILGLALYSYNTRQPKVVYEPANACSLLTLDEARTLLGPKTINGVRSTPEQSGDVAVSKCGYSDGLPDTANAVVAAVIVRSGINDAGIQLNKSQFTAGKPSAGVQDVAGIGDRAYFNTGLGQLNILKDSTWIIINYGSNADIQSHTLDDAEKVAKLVLNAQ